MIGIITLDRRYPLLPGNIASPDTYNFPVRIQKIPGLYNPPKLNSPKWKHDIENILHVANDLIANAAQAIVFSCGFFSLIQREMTRKLSVPVFTSPLMLIPFVAESIPGNGKLGILTLFKDSLTKDYFSSVGVSTQIYKRLVLSDMSDAYEFRRIILVDASTADIDKWRDEVVNASCRLVKENPEIKLLLLECSDMPPFSCLIQKAIGLPVIDYYSLVKWVASILNVQSWEHV